MIQGWRLAGVLSVLLLGMSVWLLDAHDGDVEGVRMVIRATARTSLLLFLLAFTASALAKLLPGRFTRWQLRNRRYLGMAFAFSHLIHLVAILSLAAIDRTLFWTLTNVPTILLAGVAYVLIAAMAATSFDRSAAWLGTRKWKILHLLGAWYVWISFAVAFGKRVPVDGFYWPWAALVVVAGLVRLIATRSRQTETIPGRP
jgi:sulfoxide reductase heme-binding subunit YedZ